MDMFFHHTPWRKASRLVHRKKMENVNGWYQNYEALVFRWFCFFNFWWFLHPGRLTWNIQVTHLERKMIFQTSMILFHVNLPGCRWTSRWWIAGGFYLQVLHACAGLQRPEDDFFSPHFGVATWRRWCVRHKKTGGFHVFLIFHPEPCGNDSQSDSYFFRWVGEKPPTGWNQK